MNGRVAEFAFAEDAMAFMRLKGEKEYTVCPGMNLLFAVRPKEHYEMCHDPLCERCERIRNPPWRAIPGTQGLGVEPTDYKPAPRSYDEDERHDD